MFLIYFFFSKFILSVSYSMMLVKSGTLLHNNNKKKRQIVLLIGVYINR